MPLQSGLDLVAIASGGVYSETYGAANPGNIANLAASFGYLEDAPEPASGAKLTLRKIILSPVTLTKVILRDIINHRS